MQPDSLLSFYNLPPFGEVLTDSFRHRFGLESASQYGIACTNVKSECERAKTLGAGNFITANIPAPNWIENGSKRKCKLEFALGYAGEQQIEFLGPGKGTGFYREELKGQDHTLHHVGIYQNNSDDLERRLNSNGFPTVIDGGIKLSKVMGFRFKYFDTRDEIGCYLEILDFYLLGRPLSIEKLIQSYSAFRPKYLYR